MARLSLPFFLAGLLGGGCSTGGDGFLDMFDGTAPLFTVAVSPSVVELQPGGAATVTVSITLLEPDASPPTVRVKLDDPPPGITADAIQIAAGSSGALVVTSTVDTPQIAWKTFNVVGINGRKAFAPLQLRIRGEPGSLDTTLGDGGILLVPTGTFSQCNDIAVQPDGKILLAGWSETGDLFDSTLARVMPDGAMDPSFGELGISKVTNGESSAIETVTIQPDGRILASGWIWNIFESESVDYNGLLVFRLLDDGSVDSSFGVIETNLNTLFAIPGTSRGGGTAFRQDGRIVQVGGVGNSSPVPGVLGAFEANGARYTDFGTNAGFRSFKFQSTEDTWVSAVAADGNSVYVVGDLYDSTSKLAIAKFTSSGDFDASFAGDGDLASVAFGAGTSAFVLSSGDLLVGGVDYLAGNSADAMVALFRPDGSLVDTFGSAGVLRIDGGETERGFAMPDEQERIVVFGGIEAEPYPVFVARFDRSGIPDAAFNGGAPYRTHGNGMFPAAGAFDEEGRIVICGFSNSQMALMRIWP